LTGFQLRRLQITGPQVSPAEISFGRGLNVISGASDTGKSYLVETLDFMLGGGTSPRQLPESKGYDTAWLSIAASDGRLFELKRALQGGDFELTGGVADNAAPARTLACRHSARDDENISSFLLSLVGLAHKQVRKNAENELQNLSFRNLAHLVVVDEESIIKKSSPLFSGESTQKTTQASVFKLLLTGLDDSALVMAKRTAVAKAEIEGQVAVLDEILVEYERELASSSEDPADLPAQMERLDDALAESERSLTRERDALEALERERTAAWRHQEEILTRQAEIGGLLERFALLDQHYVSDSKRLEAVSEAGYFFLALDAGRCPLCGAPAGEHRGDGVSPDGDIKALRAGCDRERSKILQLRTELAETVGALHAEYSALDDDLSKTRIAFRRADGLVRGSLAPALATTRAQHSALSEKRASVREAVRLLARIADLRRKREEATTVLEGRDRKKEERPGLPASSLKSFGEAVEGLLEAWHFPHEKPVHFDERSQDLVLGPRRRGEQGKGLRALTHAAFTIGLQETCLSLSLPSVGFVLLDSPLVTFRQADLGEAGLDSKTQMEVKQAFYRDLASRVVNSQVIIIENEDPEEALRPKIISHIFTKQSNQGRSGFFPISATLSNQSR